MLMKLQSSRRIHELKAAEFWTLFSLLVVVSPKKVRGEEIPIHDFRQVDSENVSLKRSDFNLLYIMCLVEYPSRLPSHVFYFICLFLNFFLFFSILYLVWITSSSLTKLNQFGCGH